MRYFLSTQCNGLDPLLYTLHNAGLLKSYIGTVHNLTIT